jgi:hypothetical protein
MNVQNYFVFVYCIYLFPAWVTLKASISRLYFPPKRRNLSELRTLYSQHREKLKSNHIRQNYLSSISLNFRKDTLFLALPISDTNRHIIE